MHPTTRRSRRTVAVVAVGALGLGVTATVGLSIAAYADPHETVVVSAPSKHEQTHPPRLYVVPSAYRSDDADR
jgi:hypothetical protein